MTPWWAREVTCPVCSVPPGVSCPTEPCRDRLEAALVVLEVRVAALRSELAGDARRDLSLPPGFVGSLDPDRRAAALDRLNAAVVSARALLANGSAPVDDL